MWKTIVLFQKCNKLHGDSILRTTDRKVVPKCNYAASDTFFLCGQFLKKYVSFTVKGNHRMHCDELNGGNKKQPIGSSVGLGKNIFNFSGEKK